MVDSYIKSLVDKFMSEGADTDTQGLEWRKRWLSGAYGDPNDAYQQMFSHANRYYTNKEANAASKAQAQQKATYDGLISQMSNTLTNQQNRSNEAFNTQLSSVQNAQAQATAQLQNQLTEQSNYYQSLISELQKPKYTTFNPSLYTPDTASLDSQYQQALKTYSEGNSMYDEYLTDGYGDDAYQGFLSQLGSGYSSLMNKDKERSNFQSGQVLESDYASKVQSMTDFNNAVQTQYQGLMSTISQLGALGTELYNKGQARRSELLQSRLTERANYFSQQSENQASKLAGASEQRQAGAVNRQRTRTQGSGLLSSMTR